MEEAHQDRDKPASELAAALLPHLEAVANLHYLLDWHVEAPERLKELRAVEDGEFDALLKLVVSSPPPLN